MLHWRFTAVLMVALAVASSMGKGNPLGFFW